MIDSLSHPSREALDRFARGQLSGAAQKKVLRHLFEGCAACRRRLAGKWGSWPAEEAGGLEGCDHYDEVFDRVVESVVAREPSIIEERSAGNQLFDELMRYPAAHQLLRVHNSLRFRNRFLCERFLEASHEAGFREPDRAIELAGIAVEISGLLKVDASGTDEILRGLRARAWAQYGNALRISSDHAGADRAFQEAGRILKTGWIPPLDRARILDLQASLHRDRRRFAEAAHALDRVIAVYQELGQWNLLGRALKQKSMICGEAGDTESEIALLRRALDLLDPQEEPRTFLAARHNLILALNDTGRSREAFVLLFHTRPLYLKLGDRMNLLRLRWVEGSVALGLGRTEQAATAFKEVRDAFIELGVDYDAALVSLDLAAAYVLQGRMNEVRQLAAEMLAVFRVRNINREALAALLFFHRSVEVEQVEIDVVRRVSEFLKKLRNDPDLHFEVPS